MVWLHPLSAVIHKTVQCDEAVTQFEDDRVAVLQHKRAVHKQGAQPLRNLGTWPCDHFLKDLLFQDRTVYSPTHSSMRMAVCNPSSSTAQSIKSLLSVSSLHFALVLTTVQGFALPDWTHSPMTMAVCDPSYLTSQSMDIY